MLFICLRQQVVEALCFQVVRPAVDAVMKLLWRDLVEGFQWNLITTNIHHMNDKKWKGCQGHKLKVKFVEAPLAKLCECDMFLRASGILMKHPINIHHTSGQNWISVCGVKVKVRESTFCTYSPWNCHNFLFYTNRISNNSRWQRWIDNTCGVTKNSMKRQSPEFWVRLREKYPYLWVDQNILLILCNTGRG